VNDLLDLALSSDRFAKCRHCDRPIALLTKADLVAVHPASIHNYPLHVSATWWHVTRDGTVRRTCRAANRHDPRWHYRSSPGAEP